MYARLNPVPHESLFDAIVRWTGSAPAHRLRVLLWAGSLGAVSVVTIDPAQWPVSVGMIAMAALGAWGLLEHRRSESSSRGFRAAEGVIAAVAIVAALVAIFVGLFVFLGPAPHF